MSHPINEPNSSTFAAVFHNGATAWVVLGVSIFLTIAGWFIASAYVEDRAHDRFDFEADTAVQAIAKRMQEYEQVLRGGVGLFKASQNISRVEWREYVSTLLLDTYWPGIQGIGYAEMLTPDQVGSHEAAIRAEGFSDYRVNPAGEREQYSAIVFLEPFSGRNLRAFGYDMYSEPVRREAMQRATDSGQAALSGRVTLVQETDEDVQAGFLVYLPFYKLDRPLATVAQRRAALKGFVYSAFRAEDLLHGILGNGVPAIDFQIYDGTMESADQLLYDSRGSTGTATRQAGNYSSVRSLRMQGRTWTVRFRSHATFDAGLYSAQPAFVAAGGLIVDILLFSVIFSQARRKRQVAAYAQNLSEVLKDLQKNERQLKRTHEIVRIGSWEMDLRSGVVTWSEQTYQMYGLTPGSPVDRGRFLDNVRPQDREAYEAAWQAALRGEAFDIEHRVKVGATERWVHHRAEFVFDDTGEATMVSGSVQDVSERKHSEQALNLAARVFEHAREGIMVTDAEARLLDVNPMFTEITGYTREQVVGRNPGMLASGRTPPEVYEKMWASLNEFGHWEGELWNRTRSGEQFLERISISAVRDQDSGQILNYVGLLSDVTALRLQQERMRYAAYHDMLTKLPNRYLLNDRLSVAVARAQRHQHSVVLAIIDLDGFKPVNDIYGHDVGDKTLIEVANRLRNNLREEDTVARIGGDEFAILFTDQASIDEVNCSIKRLGVELARPYEIDGNDVRISASIGTAAFSKDANSVEQLLRAADKAMYAVKQADDNCASRAS